MVAKERACQSSHGEFMVCFNRNQRARRIIHKPISMIRSDAATKGSKTLSLYNRGIRPAAPIDVSATGMREVKQQSSPNMLPKPQNMAKGFPISNFRAGPYRHKAMRPLDSH
jgi:hypothetical protein